MKKRVLLVLLALVMVLTACSSATTSSTPASETTPSEVTSETTPSEVVTPSEETPSETTPSETTPSETAPSETTPSETAPSETTSEVTSKEETSKEETSKETSSTPVAPVIEGYKIGTNPTCGLPVSATIVREMFFGDSMYQLEEKNTWMQKISERYNVKLTVECFTKSDVRTIYNARLAAGTLLGVVSIYSKEEWVGYKNDGTILPLDEYLKDNATYQMLPAAMKEAFLLDGQTWGIQGGCTGFGGGSIWARSIRADWVKAIGLPAVGTSITTDEYTNILKGFADNAGTLMTGLVPVQFRNSSFTFLDIFGAFDAVMMNESTFSYNPESNAMEDVLLKPGALDAMAYIRNIYDNGWCPKTAFDTGAFADMRTFLASGKVGSFSMYQGRYREGSSTVEGLVKKAYGLTTLKWDDLGDGYSEYINWHEKTWVDTLLTGTRTKNVEVFSNAGGGVQFVLMKGTPQPKETINYVVDLWFAADNNYFESRWGLLDDWYVKQSDGSFMRKFKDKAADTYWCQLGTCALIDQVSPSPYPNGKFSVWDEDRRGPADKRNAASNAYKTALDTTALEAGLVYTTKGEYFSPQINSAQWLTYAGEANAYAMAFMIDGFTKGKSKTLDKLLAEYKTNMNAINGDLMLKEMNQAFGMTNNYQSYK